VPAAGGSFARPVEGWNRHEELPWGALLVNVAGSFALGLLHDVGPPVITVLGIGGLGALTTFTRQPPAQAPLDVGRSAELSWP